MAKQKTLEFIGSKTEQEGDFIRLYVPKGRGAYFYIPKDAVIGTPELVDPKKPNGPVRVSVLRNADVNVVAPSTASRLHGTITKKRATLAGAAPAGSRPAHLADIARDFSPLLGTC